VIRVDDITDEDHGTGFHDAALAHGRSASLSVSLILGGVAQGGLNAYGAEPGAFSENDEHIATGFAAQASVVVANAQAYWASFAATHTIAPARMPMISNCGRTKRRRSWRNMESNAE